MQRLKFLSLSVWALVVHGAALVDPWSLAGTKALVTGGSKGIGKAVVEEFIAQGAEVLTCARDVSSITPVPGLHIIEADVSTTEGRQCLLDYITEKMGGELDCLVNNVGTNIRKLSEEFTDEEYDRLMRTNMDSAFHLSRHCLAFLKGSKRGCVINISSISGVTVDNTGAPYHMTKAAMNHMTRCE